MNTVEDAIRELVQREAVPPYSPLREASLFRRWYFLGGPPLGLINAPWHYVIQAAAWAEELDRQAWLRGIRQRLRLVTIDGGMPPLEPQVKVWLLPPHDPRPSVLGWTTPGQA